MRVMHVVMPAAYGGLERVVQSLATAQAAAGEQAHVAIVTNGDDAAAAAFAAPLRAARVTVHAVRAARRAYWRERAAVSDLCARVEPDIVHTHGYRADVINGPPARAAGAATVSTVHGFTGGDARNQCYEWLQRQALRHCDAVAAAATPIAERLARAGVPRERIRVVPNAWVSSTPVLEPRAAGDVLGAPRDRFHIGWVGRVSHEKGLDVMLDALELLGPGHHLTIVGDGPARARLCQRVAQSAIADAVRWHGALASAERIIRAFDVLAITSRSEGTPMVLLEAMAAGVPVVATAVGGVPDVVSPFEAQLVAPECPGAIARAIAHVRDDPDAARRGARRARLRLDRNFTADRWLADYRAVYAAALGRTARA
jgi:glycosyltransferase involved in cell wall biosynthesis